MTSWFVTLFFSFIPILIAIDPFGLLPIFVSITHGLNKSQKRKVIYQTILTALSASLLFVFLGKMLFNILQITVSDFQIAGGIVLLVFSITDIMIHDRIRTIRSKTIGIVPLGIPLIVGPALLTTIVYLIDLYGICTIIAATMINLIIVNTVLSNAPNITKWIGQGGSKAFSKITSLLLAAIAVMMVRKGIYTVMLWNQ